MLYALSFLWGGFALWGVTAKCLSLALAELDRHRQLEEQSEFSLLRMGRHG